MVTRASSRVQRGHHFAIVDEVDSILIDEARTPLIISGAGTQAADTYKKFARVMPGLKEGVDFDMDEAKRTINATESGLEKIEVHARHRRHLRRPVRSAPEPLAAGAQSPVPLPPRRAIRRHGRRGQDRRRVHGPHHGGAPLLRGPAPGARGQRARARARGEPDVGHHHAAELLPPLRQALRHDGYRHDRGRGVPPDLQAAGHGHSPQ